MLLITELQTQAALVFLSASVLQRAQCKGASTSSKHLSMSRDNRLWIGGGGTSSENRMVGGGNGAVPVGVFTDASVIKDIFSLESKIAELGSLPNTSSGKSRGAAMSSSTSSAQAENQQVSTSQLLSSFISTRQLIDNSTITGTLTATQPQAAQNAGFYGNDSSNNSNQLLDNMPSVLDESYMFLSKMQPQTYFDPRVGTAVRSIPFSNNFSNNTTNATRQHKLNHSSGTGGGGSGGGGDDGVASSASIDKLLGTMRRLEQENSQLVSRINELLELERKSELKQRQMQEFKQDFAVKYSKLKQVLVAYAKKYPYPDNPVMLAQQGEGGGGTGIVSGIVAPETYTGGGSMSGSGVVGAEGVDLKKVVKQLEQAMRAALTRASKLQKKVDEKNRTIAEYENYYRRKKLEQQQQKSGVGISSASSSSSPSAHVISGSGSSSGAGMSRGSVTYVNPDAHPPRGGGSSSSSGGGGVAATGLASRKNPATRTFEASLQHRNQV